MRQILRRLPKEPEHELDYQRKLRLIRLAKEEALYYAWKIGTAGVLPSMVLGNNLLTSGKNSLKFVKAKFVDILKLRAAYSSICWVVGIAAYLGAIMVMFFMGDGVYSNSGNLDVVKIYQYMIIPIGIAAMVVMIFLRPVYILTLCNLYSDFLESTDEKPILPNDPSVGKKALYVFAFMCLLMILVIIFRDEIGLTEILSTANITNS